MKRILFILSISIVCLYTVSCRKDWNDENDLFSKGYEVFTFLDYKRLPSSSFPALNGYFTPQNASKGYLEDWLNKTRPEAKVGETVMISYYFMDYDHPDSLNNLSGGLTTVRTEDYKEIWGDLFVEAFTPSKQAATEIPSLLQKRFPNAKEGEYRIVSYHQSEVEPTVEYLDQVVYDEDFSTFTGTASGAKVTLPGSYNENLTVSTRSWHIYNRNAAIWGAAMYANFNSNRGGDGWLVLAPLDLASIQDIVFSFDLGVGYSRTPGEKNYMTVLVTEEFDGEDPLNSTWTDITTALGVYSAPKQGSYPTYLDNLQIDLSQYAGKKIYVAFRAKLPLLPENYAMSEYYVVDNIKVTGKVEQLSLSSSEEVYTVYKREENGWSVLNSVYVLQPSDYQSLGQDFLSAEEAHTQLPVLLSSRITDPQDGDTKAVVYRQNSTQLYAENYTYKNGQWQYVSRPPLEKRTNSFRYTYPDEKWQQID